ncbi:glycosyltransferase [Altericroceibacterium spongiae]|uniref:Glycosyltransferase n=1 Tax=Altericroceibacterium spongiae TaxID=2320269 RepID=A0A420EC86_9SPHN|nr:glycosyltransferase [Altericroceibacterium spongiae]RKF18300.1 glycosyltransferase [Altericroceibacterium spongiae]
MIRAIHLLDDFSMGGVTRGMMLHHRPELAELAHSDIVPVSPRSAVAPRFDAELILTHFPPSWSNFAFLFSLRMRNPKARLVHVEHTYTRSFEKHRVPSPCRFHKMLRWTLALFDEVICVSRAQAEWLQAVAAITPSKMHVIYPWSSRPALLDVPVLPRRQADKPLRFAAYGRFATPKNFIALIEAVKRFPAGKVELHLGGSGPDENAMRKAAQEAGHIHFHGLIDDVPAFLAPCDAVIVPSQWEAFGQVAEEARLAGRPILVADVDGLPEQINPFCPAGFAAPMDTADEIETAIRGFMRLPLAEMGQHGRITARTIEAEVIAGWSGVYQRATEMTARNTSFPLRRAA